MQEQYVVSKYWWHSHQEADLLANPPLPQIPIGTLVWGIRRTDELYFNYAYLNKDMANKIATKFNNEEPAVEGNFFKIPHIVSALKP